MSAVVRPWSPATPALQWPNGAAKAAVSLSYDDSLPSQFQVGARQLEAKGFRGTFFVMNSKAGKPLYESSFKALAKKGHDISGHHASCGDFSATISNEAMALAKKLDPSGAKTLAYPCGKTQHKSHAINAGFIGARGVRGVINRPGFDRWNANSLSVGHTSLAAVLNHFKNALKAGGWASYHFHAISGTSAQHHAALVNALASANDIWVAPFSVVMQSAIRSKVAN